MPEASLLKERLGKYFEPVIVAYEVVKIRLFFDVFAAVYYPRLIALR